MFSQKKEHTRINPVTHNKKIKKTITQKHLKKNY